MKVKNFNYLGLFIGTLLALGVGTESLFGAELGPKVGPSSGPESHSGYISDVEAERKAEEREESFFVVWDIEVSKGEPLSDRIFTERLKREFKGRYENKFGRTSAEQNIEFFSPDDYYLDQSGNVITSGSIRKRERDFGEYMIRRLAEFHLDNKMKKDPQARKVYQFKEKLSKAEVSIAKGYKVKSQYSISSNSLKLEAETPYVDTKIESDLNDWATFGEAQDHLLVSATRKINKTVRVSAYYRTGSGTLKVVGKKYINKRLSTDLSITPNKGSGDSQEVFGVWGANYRF